MDYREGMETLTSTLLGLARSRRRAALPDASTEAVLRSVGHELRSPLAAIMMAASTLKRSDLELEREEREDLTATIATEAARLDWLLSHPRELLGPEQGAPR